MKKQVQVGIVGLALSWSLPALADPAGQGFIPEGFPRYAFNINTGALFFGGSDDDGAGGELSLQDEEFFGDPAFTVGAQAETWLNSQFAIRMRGSYSGPDLEFNDREIADATVFLTDVNFMYRPFSPMGSRRITPFISAGAGAAYYDADDFLAPAGTAFDDGFKFTGVVSAGIDIMPNTPTKSFGAFIRMEVSDHIVFDSPFGGDGALHNVGTTLGMNLIFPLRPNRN